MIGSESLKNDSWRMKWDESPAKEQRAGARTMVVVVVVVPSNVGAAYSFANEYSNLDRRGTTVSFDS